MAFKYGILTVGVDVTLPDGSVTEPKLASNAVSVDKIVDDAITNAKLAVNAVGTQELIDAAVVTSKLDAAAITTAKIANAAITTALIDNAAITTALIADLAVTDAKIAALAVSKLTAGALAVGSYIESTTYNPDDEQSPQGFHIDADGSATFAEVEVGNQGYNIDSAGVASVDSVYADTEITVDGESLTELIDRRGKGILQITEIYGESDALSGSTLIVAKLVVPNVKQRIYKVEASNFRVIKGGDVVTFIRMAGFYALNTTGTSATASDERFLIAQPATEGSGGENEQTYHSGSGTINIDSADVGKDLHIAIGLRGEGADAGTVKFKPSATVDRCRIIVFDLGPAISINQVEITSTTVPDPVTEYTKEYDCTWHAAFDREFDKLTSSPQNQYVYQGDYSGSNDRYTKLGFNRSTIASDIGSGTVLKCELRLKNLHTWYSSGMTCYIGSHDDGSEPSHNWDSPGTHTQAIVSRNFDRYEKRWVTIPNSIIEAFVANTRKGILIGKTGTGQTKNDYGYFAGYGSPDYQIPKLRVTYEK